jgi:hypothetical protein
VIKSAVYYRQKKAHFQLSLTTGFRIYHHALAIFILRQQAELKSAHANNLHELHSMSIDKIKPTFTSKVPIDTVLVGLIGVSDFN